MVQLNPVPVFCAKKNTSTIWQKFFTEISVKMVSPLNFARTENVKEKNWQSRKISPVNEKHLLILISLFQDYALSINKCSSTIKRYPGFLNFYYQHEKSQKWTHWFNRHYYQLIAQSLRSVQNTFFFLTDKTFSSCLWAFFVFCFS